MTVELRARPTTYNGIEMRSRLEARVGAFLDEIREHQVGTHWTYEPRAFASGGKQYLPDFVVEPIYDPDAKARQLYLEIKGELPHGEALSNLVARMKTIWASEPDALLGMTDGSMLEKGMLLVLRESGHPVLAVLMVCPHDPTKIVLAVEYRHSHAYFGRCSDDCGGVSFRTTGPDTRIGLPKWRAES